MIKNLEQMIKSMLDEITKTRRGYSFRGIERKRCGQIMKVVKAAAWQEMTGTTYRGR